MARRRLKRNRRAGTDTPPPQRAASDSPRREEPAHDAARVPELDALRGVAIVAMIAYHFCFDLRYFGLLRADFEHDWRWITARTLILSTFLLCAGIGMVLAHRDHPAGHGWMRRVLAIAASAVAVSAASYLMFPQTYIWFGVLHAIALSLVLARPFVPRPAAAVAAGIAIIVAGLALANPAFDNRSLGWLGFMTQKPPTEDYVPLFPWSGVMLLGIGAGHVLVRTRFSAIAALARAPASLRWLGRHSLAVYLVHQPLMIGLLWLAAHRR